MTEALFLSISQSDDIWTRLVTLWKPGFEGKGRCFFRTWSIGEADTLFRWLSSFGQHVGHEELLLFNRYSEDCGAHRLSAQLIFTHVPSLLALDGNDVYVSTYDASKSLIVSLLEDDYAASGKLGTWLELWAWGDEWMRLLEVTTPKLGNSDAD
jgi:hypothetical protein